jgi:RNA polymerase sigma-70 factor (ECF subfamily)
VIAANRVAYSEVLARLQLLPEVDRAVLLMSAFDGIPYADIAKALEISVPAVKMKIHRARLALSRVEESK